MKLLELKDIKNKNRYMQELQHYLRNNTIMLLIANDGSQWQFIKSNGTCPKGMGWVKINNPKGCIRPDGLYGWPSIQQIEPEVKKIKIQNRPDYPSDSGTSIKQKVSRKIINNTKWVFYKGGPNNPPPSYNEKEKNWIFVSKRVKEIDLFGDGDNNEENDVTKGWYKPTGNKIFKKIIFNNNIYIYYNGNNKPNDIKPTGSIGNWIEASKLKKGKKGFVLLIKESNEVTNKRLRDLSQQREQEFSNREQRQRQTRY